MPTATVNGAKLYYETTDNAPDSPSKETIVFSHGLLYSGQMFEAQVARLSKRYRCVTYDHRGQGRSQVTPTGYDMENIYKDSVMLIEHLGLAPCHFVGLSMGGFVGMRIAARRPELLKSLMLLETSAEAEPNKLKYIALSAIVRLLGVSSVIKPVSKVMFGHTFLSRDKYAEARARWVNVLAGNSSQIVKAVDGVIYRKAIVHELQKINLPTLVVVGDEDAATAPAKAQAIHINIRGSRLVTIPHAGHSSCVEQPEAVTAALEEFFAGLK